jgi:hypothetical protein
MSATHSSHEPFVRGQKVIWKRPEDLDHWQKQYEWLVRAYGARPLEVEDTITKSKRQYLVLKGKRGILLTRRGKPEHFPASWVKEMS